MAQRGLTYKHFLLAGVAALGGFAVYYYFNGTPQRAVAVERRRRGRARRRVAVETSAAEGDDLPEPLPVGVRPLPQENMDPVPPLSGNGMAAVPGVHDLRTRKFGADLMQGGPPGGPTIVPRAAFDNTPTPAAALGEPETYASLYANHPPPPSQISPPVLTKCYTPFEPNCTNRCGDPASSGEWPEPKHVHGRSACERKVRPMQPFNAVAINRQATAAASGGYVNLANDALAQTITNASELPSFAPGVMLPGME